MRQRIVIHSGPDGQGRYAYTLCWMTGYHPGDPAGEYRWAERGQVYHRPLPEYGWRPYDPQTVAIPNDYETAVLLQSGRGMQATWGSGRWHIVAEGTDPPKLVELSEPVVAYWVQP